ncbi:hypothetical protein LXL04_011533 [Taraxacum kok-saghyz]
MQHHSCIVNRLVLLFTIEDSKEKRIVKMMKLFKTFLLISLAIVISAIDEERKVFIVYLGSLPEGEFSASVHHNAILQKVMNPRLASKLMIMSYKRSFNGFAAYLSQEEQQKLGGLDEVISVFPSQKLKLHTTRSWDFMGFPSTVERSLTSESNTIVGIIDSGIWPESQSFGDEGLGPIPEKWKGGCHGGTNFTCNRKIIGARFYGDVDSARDTHGHGTHAASIVAGNKVKNANFYSLAEGVARGGVPSARLAVYKACDVHCYDIDMLLAFDDAIADGVDVISISIGRDHPRQITIDSVAIGAFHAVERGILTVQSAGNGGPSMYSVQGFAPWILSVAASYTDRTFVNKVLLGDGTTLLGTSINAFPYGNEELPLVYGKQVTSKCSETDARNCHLNCLDSMLVENKVVMCDQITSISVVKAAKGFGCIVPNEQNNVSLVRSLPVGALNTNDINLVKTYLNSTQKPKIKIFKSEAIKNPDAPFVAPFSSRGPSKFISGIIKPDIMAPGVEILAAFPPMTSPSETSTDQRSVKYNILSGTSMACPHVAAAAAYVKSFHPNWSPSAIKSALMTTAWEINPNHNLGAEFAYGSGHMDPHKAKDPGLIYETSKQDYQKIWCNITLTVGGFTTGNASCPATIRELNYPSMAVQVYMRSSFVVSFPRTVTNVGKANSRYVAHIQGSSNLQISVDPVNLQFTTLKEKKSFMVTVRGKGILTSETSESGSLVWSDGIYTVRSPIVVYTGTTNSIQVASTPPRITKTSVILLVTIVTVYCICV